MSQKNVFESIVNKLKKEEGSRFMITGPAGVGKTYLLIDLARYLSNQHIRYKIICPTNKSKLNILKSLSRLDTEDEMLSVSISKRIKTYCAYFKCYLDPFDIIEDTIEMNCSITCCEDPSHNTLKDRYLCMKHNKKQYHVPEKVLLIEEVSLLDHVFYEMLKMTNVETMIFIGDSNQIPAINSGCLSSRCNDPCEFSIFGKSMKKYYLTEQMRHADIVTTLVNKFITSIENNFMKRSNTKKILESIFRNRIKTLDSILPLHSPLITYHARRTDNINKMLTQCREDFIVGDWITIDSGGTDTLPVGSVDYIKNISRQDLISRLLETTFEFQVIEFSNGERLHMISPDKRDIYIEYVKELKNRWKGNLYPLHTLIREHLSVIKYAYCTTAHKAQGLTFRNSYIDYYDMLNCKDNILSIRLLYSAMTRAAEDIILVKIPEYFQVKSMKETLKDIS